MGYTCPKCKRAWDEFCQQVDCIDLYGECITCRFATAKGGNLHGSGKGTAEELATLEKLYYQRKAGVK